jgi:propionyl-CoA carboxylase alpha chain
MFDRLLIANRGEIVYRVARTARSLGIATVGVYSDPDRNAPHVEAVDVAVALGGAAPAESYLRGDAIIEIALAHGCDAVHPGYGFLSENAGFARATIDAGLVWVGPTPDQITLLGDKIAAKRIAVEAGVPASPVVEATPHLDPDALTYPVLVKASAGGGGRGMRVVTTPGELAAAVESASREAASAFGDGTVFVEPYIEGGRHIEIQIMGDRHGNIVHFGERECSIQRRNQKLLEEAPAPGLDRHVRDQLCESAIALARHVGYENAGTVEFIVGDTGGEASFDLLEVNTRLQVEHRVTEQAWGVDLVALQLRVAAGEPLPLDVVHESRAPAGHAIEIRLVAEVPSRDWQPWVGPVGDSFDAGADGASVAAGSTITSHYDSLIANIVGAGNDRVEALERLRSEISRIDVGGLRTNRETMAAILHEPDFLAGRITTAYLHDHPELLSAGVVCGETLVAHLIAVALADEQRNRAGSITGFAPSGWRNLRTAGQRRTWIVDGDAHHIEYVIDGELATVDVGDPASAERRRLAARLLARHAHRQVVELDGTRFAVSVELSAHGARSRSAGGTVEWIRPQRFADHDPSVAGGGPVSPLPGTVIAVHVEPGQRVGGGTVLMAVEAMKMEHKIVAAGDATVVAVHFRVGDRVDTGDLLVELDLDDW